MGRGPEAAAAERVEAALTLRKLSTTFDEYDDSIKSMIKALHDEDGLWGMKYRVCIIAANMLLPKLRDKQIKYYSYAKKVFAHLTKILYYQPEDNTCSTLLHKIKALYPEVDSVLDLVVGLATDFVSFFLPPSNSFLEEEQRLLCGKLD